MALQFSSQILASHGCLPLRTSVLDSSTPINAVAAAGGGVLKAVSKTSLGVAGPVLSLRFRPKIISTTSFRFRCLSALTPELKTTLDKVVTSQKIVLFMKGTKEFPQCGFSNTVVQILRSLNAPFETINILENEVLRQGLKEYSSWPTFPQLYIDGEFFGGCDITVGEYDFYY
ncbi:OLC1v1011900C1 [Oldenlandia corymbosa var. corymbosa]|uniref:OLC1v1011900C1 n=1 Tax=Oldenlandia corymbosa var. corymbosa TaxID=529605 RepID=A0AAV1DX45_OLDCO|nr:OLC1v1011900C1 [Oldenlandia corymbosa var. corymbosa]